MHVIREPGVSNETPGTVSTNATVLEHHAGFLRLRGTPAQSCGGCIQQSGCASRSFGADRSLIIPMESPTGLEAGDTVAISIAARDLLRAAANCYLLPAAAALGGAVLAGYIVEGDLAALCGALGGLFVGSWPLRLYDARVSYSAGSALSSIRSGLARLRIDLT